MRHLAHALYMAMRGVLCIIGLTACDAEPCVVAVADSKLGVDEQYYRVVTRCLYCHRLRMYKITQTVNHSNKAYLEHRDKEVN